MVLSLSLLLSFGNCLDPENYSVTKFLGHKGATLAESTGLYALGYENNGLMLLSPMALIMVGIIIWVQRARNRKLIEA